MVRLVVCYRCGGRLPTAREAHDVTALSLSADLGRWASCRPRSSSVLSLGQLLVVHQDEHRLARHTHHRDDESDPGIRAIVAILVVDHIAAGLPERFPGPDDSLRLAFQLEAHLALHDVAESRS